jgi:hypothetical protein
MSHVTLPPQMVLLPDHADLAAPQPDALPTALLAECTCPDWCERDHDRD